MVEKKKKYACPACEDHMVQARANSILPGTIATVELISFLIFSKFFQGLPLYRLKEFFNLKGVDLKRGTMASWLIVYREPETKSFMWARGSPELGIVLFDYNISGAGYVAKNLVADFRGALQGDAHRGYEQLTDMLRLGCMMHSRRRFYEAFLTAKKKPGYAQEEMSMGKKIYKFEEMYKDQGTRMSAARKQE